MKITSVNRRTWIAAHSVGLVGFKLGNSDAQEFEESITTDLDIIDCHTHFYDPKRKEGVPWPAKGTALYRTVLPQHLRALKQFRPVTGTVIVEASSRVADNAWLLNIAKNDPFVVGIVGRLEPGGADFAKNLKRFAANPLFRGIRVSEKLVRKLLLADNLEDFQHLADHDLALDVNGGRESLGVVAQLAGRLPKLRIIQNHMGNVAVTANPPSKEWQNGILAAAKHKNVFCKISALVESAAHHTKKKPPRILDFYRPYINVVWNAFGDDRVIYGSNWPVSERAASYEMLQRIVMEYVFEKGKEATRKFCALNAKKAYKWIERSGRR